MSPARAYRSRTRNRTASTATRERIVSAVGDLLEEGTFHEATVEEVADRAGVARATLYQHFGSRLGLVDAICETFARSDELQLLKHEVEVGDPVDALDGLIANVVRFCAVHERRLAPLYGVAGVDEAAARLVARQRNDRRSVARRLVRRLHAHGLLRDGLGERHAIAALLLLTSFETYIELRRTAALPEREVVRLLRELGRSQLLADRAG